MTQNPILKVLLTFRKHRVKCLLIGGQACIIYGAAEFSRDSDFAVLCTPGNLELLRKALAFLKAELIYFPAFEAAYLERGHACHFRCAARGVKDLRVDILSRLRGCESFEELWQRKNTISLENGGKIDVIGLHDLVQSKKTQRDKDWWMLKRLVENDIILHQDNPSDDRIKWWFQESRNPQRLVELAEQYPAMAKQSVAVRPLMSFAVTKNPQRLEAGLQDEERAERQKDMEYWTPLKRELETLRHQKAA